MRSVSTEVPGTPVMTTILPLPLSFLASHSAVTRPGFFLVDRHVVGAGLGNLAVIGDDHDALVAGVLDRAVQGGRRNRIDDDRLRALLHHGVDLLDLALRVGAGDLHLQVDLVGEILMRRHGLDHVGGLGLPVVADVAHRQEYLEFLVGGVSARRQGRCWRQSAAPARPPHFFKWRFIASPPLLPVPCGRKFAGGGVGAARPFRLVIIDQ